MSSHSSDPNLITPPRTSTPLDEENDLPRGLVYSLLAHGSLILLVMLKSLIFPSNPTPLIPTLRVDIVGLPDQLKSEKGGTPPPPSKELQDALAQAEKAAKELQLDTPPVKPRKPDPVPEPVTKNEMAIKNKTEKKSPTSEKGDSKKRQEKMTSAITRLKALQKIASETSENAPSPEAGGVALKGNKISKGHSQAGEFTENSESGYLERLRDRLSDRWSLPVWVARKNLSAQAQVWIDRRGQLIRFEFKRTSGNPQFDEAVKSTILSSQPFPAPPRELTGSLESNGILVGFPL
jgi:outer membrane biosynthesis protein TonB